MKKIHNTHSSIDWRARSVKTALLVLGFLQPVTGTLTAHAEESDIQSAARPFGLDIVAPVYEAGSDEAAVTFQTDYLPTLNDWIDQTLGETVSLDNISSYSLDPSQLTLTTASDVRVYFIGEGAGYKNTLGFYTDGSNDITTGDAQLIFPNVTSNVSYMNATDLSNASANINFPLVPGDFVDLGTMDAGTELDFFLIADGASGGTNVYSTDASLNPDGIDHVVAYAVEDSPYLLVGFEDLFGGGDQDYNDVLFAIDIGSVNVDALTTASEPSTVLLLGSFLLLAIYLKNRQQHLAAERQNA